MIYIKKKEAHECFSRMAMNHRRTTLLAQKVVTSWTTDLYVSKLNGVNWLSNFGFNVGVGIEMSELEIWLLGSWFCVLCVVKNKNKLMQKW